MSKEILNTLDEELNKYVIGEMVCNNTLLVAKTIADKVLSELDYEISKMWWNDDVLCYTIKPREQYRKCRKNLTKGI